MCQLPLNFQPTTASKKQKKKKQRVTVEPDSEYWPVEISDTASEVYFRDYQHFQRFLRRYRSTYGKHFQHCVVRFTVKEKAETITDIYR
jgi:hypothetical protein